MSSAMVIPLKMVKPLCGALKNVLIIAAAIPSKTRVQYMIDNVFILLPMLGLCVDQVF